MLDDADLGVVVEREIDVLVRDQVDRGALAGRAADGEAERAVAGGEQEERGREDRARSLLRIAEEAPRPLPGLDPAGGESRHLRLEPVEPRGHDVVEDPTLETEWRPVEVVVCDQALVLLSARAR